MLQVDPIQSYLNLKMGLLPVLKAGSSGMCHTYMHIVCACFSNKRGFGDWSTRRAILLVHLEFGQGAPVSLDKIRSWVNVIEHSLEGFHLKICLGKVRFTVQIIDFHLKLSKWCKSVLWMSVWMLFPPPPLTNQQIHSKRNANEILHYN